MKGSHSVKCSIKYCRKKRGKGKTICYMHVMRKYKENHPVEYTFNALRCNARRRGKEFTLTIAQFRKFVKETDYMNKKGKTKLSLSIDRKDDSQGYHHWNIRAITLSDNSSRRRGYTNAPF